MPIIISVLFTCFLIKQKSVHIDSRFFASNYSPTVFANPWFALLKKNQPDGWFFFRSIKNLMLSRNKEPKATMFCLCRRNVIFDLRGRK